MLIEKRRPNPLWAAAFPRLALNCIWEEKANKEAFIHVFTFSGFDYKLQKEGVGDRLPSWGRLSLSPKKRPQQTRYIVSKATHTPLTILVGD